MVEFEPDGTRSWIVAGVATFALVFTFGTPFSFGILVGPLSDQSGISQVAISTVFSIMFFMFYVFAGLLGVFVTQVQVRTVLFAAGATTLLLSPSLYVVGTYPGFVVVFSVLGTALGVVFVTLASVVPQWFDERRGTATGVLFVGTGVSLFAMPPLWTLAIDTLGTEYGFFGVVLSSALSFLLAGVVCRRPPWMDLENSSTTALGPWLWNRIRSGQFWQLFVGMGLSLSWYYLLAGYAIGLFESRGLTRTTASVAFGLVGGVSIVSRLTSGAVADELGYVRTLLASIGVAAVGSVLLLVPSTVTLAVAILLLGIALGGISTLYIPVLLEVYTPEKDTAIIGIFNVSFGAFAVGAPPIATTLVETSGAYWSVVLLTASTSLMAWIVLYRGINVE